MRYKHEPKHNDMSHVVWVLLGALILGVILAPLIWWLVPSPAHAVVTSGYYAMSTVSRNFDSWTVTSCSLFVVGGWDGGNPDSTVGFTTAMVDGPGAYGFDTLARFSIINPAQLDQDYNPSFYFIWRLSDGRVIRDDKPMVHMISYLDYLRTPVDAVAVVDYDEMDSVLSANHGPGLWGSSGGTGNNVVRVYVRDTTDDVNLSNMPFLMYASDATTIEGWGISNVTGYFDFSLNNGTYFGRVNTPPGYLQATANDTIVVSGATQDTIEVFSYFVAPAAPGLTQVQFIFYDGLGNAIKNVVLRYQLETKATTAYHLRDSSIVIDPSKVWEARSSSVGVATINVTPNDSILVTGGKVDQTKWRVKAYTPDGQLPLLGNDGVALSVPASASALVYPQDFE